MPTLPDAMTTLLPSAPLLLAFLGATLVTLAVPGPSVLYVVTRSTAHGRRAGLLSVLGLETGAAIHVLAAALGLAALLARSPVAFDAVRWCGAAYLVWLGIRELRTVPGSGRDGAGPQPASRWRLFADGVLVDVLNPKTAVFFLAFLPQFVDTGRPPAAGQLAALGLVFVALAAAVDSTYAVLAARMAARWRTSGRVRAVMGRAAGGIYLALAGAAVVAR